MASKKAKQLADKARTPPRSQPLYQRDDNERLGHRRVTVTLYTPEADYVDRVAHLLRKAGVWRANRSMVVQQLILMGKEQLEERAPEQVVGLLADRVKHRRDAGLRA